MTLYGYARVSTEGQREALENQVALLTQRGVLETNLVVEVESSRNPLPVRDALIGQLQEGDEILVFKLFRIGRNMTDMLDAVNRIGDRGATLRTTDGFLAAPGTAIGKLILTVMAAFAEFERDNTRERMLEGVARAKKAGKYRGRAPALRNVPTDELAAMVQSLGVQRAATHYGVARQTIYSTCQRRGISIDRQG